MIYTKDINEAINYIKTSEKIDVSSRPDTAVFYSGGEEVKYKGKKEGENYQKADEFCDKNPAYTTLDRTPFGQYLKKNHGELEKTFGEIGVEKLWQAASERYANEASGKIVAFIEEAKHDKVFRKHELKTLINNEKVIEINGVPREELKKDLQKSFDLQSNLAESFQKVKDSNVGKDLRIAWDGEKELIKTYEFEYKGKIYEKVGTKQEMSDFLEQLKTIKENQQQQVSQQQQQPNKQNQSY